MHWFFVLGSLKNLTTGLIWLVTRGRCGGMGGGVGRWPMEGGQGGRWGATKGALVPPFGLPKKPNNWSDLAGDKGGGMGRRRGEVLLGSLQNPTTGLIWLVTRGGGWGKAWEGGPWRAGKGGDGGGTREQCGSNKSCTGSFWAPLKT